LIPESETLSALKRAGERAAYHLLRAVVEGLKAVEAVVDELGKLGREEPPSDQSRHRIEVE
jgi:hypothetical protein